MGRDVGMGEGRLEGWMDTTAWDTHRYVGTYVVTDVCVCVCVRVKAFESRDSSREAPRSRPSVRASEVPQERAGRRIPARCAESRARSLS